MKLVPFSEIVIDMKRGPFGSTIKKEHFVPDGYKVYEQQNAIYDNHKLGRYFISSQKYKELEGFKVSPGDFLVSCSGTLGKVTRIPDDASPGVINQALLRLRIDEKKIDPLFFLHLFRSDWIQGKLVLGAKGVAIKNFAGVKELKEIQVPLFSIEQQKKISRNIERLFAEIDAGTEDLQKAKQKLEHYKQSVLNSATQGRLVPQDPKADPASKQLEKIRAEKEKKLKKEKPLPHVDLSEMQYELPKGWEWARLGDILSVGTGSTPLKSNKAYYQNGKVPWLTSSVTSKPFVNEAEHFITTKALDETNCKLFPAGTLLVAMYGEGKTRGQVTEMTFEATTNQALAAILFDETSKYLKDFIKICFLERYEKIRMEAIGGNQPNLSIGTIKSQIIPIPPASEQLQISKKVTEALEQIGRMNGILESNIEKSQQLKQSILKSAFEGKLI